MSQQVLEQNGEFRILSLIYRQLFWIMKEIIIQSGVNIVTRYEKFYSWLIISIRYIFRSLICMLIITSRMCTSKLAWQTRLQKPPANGSVSNYKGSEMEGKLCVSYFGIIVMWYITVTDNTSVWYIWYPPSAFARIL